MDWLSLKTSRAAVGIALLAFASACSDDSSELSGPPSDAAARKNKTAESSVSSNSTSSAADYCINVVKDGTVWTYTITKKPGAKGISHFILDLNNCEGNQTLNFNSILWATVNDQPATLEDSEGNTGCELTTDNFVKFDDLPDASVYVIVFELDEEYGNVLETTAWIKAGTSCNSYIVRGPCCA